MRRITGGLVALLAGFVFVVANAAGAGASPNLTVVAASFPNWTTALECCGANTSFQIQAQGTATLVGTLSAGGHTFIGTATLGIGFAAYPDCTNPGAPFQTCSQSSVPGGGSISGAGIGSIKGTCSTVTGTYLDQKVDIVDVALLTLPLTCSISFSGSPPQAVPLSISLVVPPVLSGNALAVGAGLG